MRDERTNAIVPEAVQYLEGDNYETVGNYLYKRDAKTNALIPVVNVIGGGQSSAVVPNLQDVTNQSNETTLPIKAGKAVYDSELALLGQVKELIGKVTSIAMTVEEFQNKTFENSIYVKITDNSNLNINTALIQKITKGVVVTIKAGGSVIFPTKTLNAMPVNEYREISIFKDFEGKAQITYFDLNVIQV